MEVAEVEAPYRKNRDPLPECSNHYSVEEIATKDSRYYGGFKPQDAQQTSLMG